MRSDFEVPYEPKAIPCRILSSKSTKSSPSLIFTHGAKGTLDSAGVLNFAEGFSESSLSPIVCFQGNSNLVSRTKMFGKVIENQDFSRALGGRSLGARAAVQAATESTECLVLVSYPLAGGQEREQILLDLRHDIKVLFLVGDKDSLCDLEELGEVRKKMSCRSWMIRVENANHGMEMKPKRSTEAIGRMTGQVAADWLRASADLDPGLLEGSILWSGDAIEEHGHEHEHEHEHEPKAVWSGWSEVAEKRESASHLDSGKDQDGIVTKPGTKKRSIKSHTATDTLPEVETREEDKDPTEAVSSRTRKRTRKS